jgi:hypothetical protein
LQSFETSNKKQAQKKTRSASPFSSFLSCSTFLKHPVAKATMVVLAGDSIREWCKRRSASDHHANDLRDQSADIVERTTCHRH